MNSTAAKLRDKLRLHAWERAQRDNKINLDLINKNDDRTMIKKRQIIADKYRFFDGRTRRW